MNGLRTRYGFILPGALSVIAITDAVFGISGARAPEVMREAGNTRAARAAHISGMAPVAVYPAPAAPPVPPEQLKESVVPGHSHTPAGFRNGHFPPQAVSRTGHDKHISLQPPGYGREASPGKRGDGGAIIYREAG